MLIGGHRTSTSSKSNIPATVHALESESSMSSPLAYSIFREEHISQSPLGLFSYLDNRCECYSPSSMDSLPLLRHRPYSSMHPYIMLPTASPALIPSEEIRISVRTPSTVFFSRKNASLFKLYPKPASQLCIEKQFFIASHKPKGN